MTAAIDTTDLTKMYGGQIAVDHLTVSIEEGEFFALLGLNGAGKTTTIKMLTSLLAPTSGVARLLGTDVGEDPTAVKERINVSPQETAVAPNLSVRENLELVARIYGCTAQEARSRADGMLKDLDLTDRASDRAKVLSGGLQRRLSIGMALITRPEIVFLDEPTLGLDIRARRALWETLERLKGQVTIVLTTHYLEEAEALSDRVGIMQDGRLRALGTVDEMKSLTGKSTFEDAFLSLTEAEEIPS